MLSSPKHFFVTTSMESAAIMQFPQRRRSRFLVVGLLLASCGLLNCDLLSSSSRAQADEYPSKLVTVICPWSAGGGTDRVARFWAESLQKKYDSPFVVVNRVGGAGAIGHFAGAHAPPDGHTLAVITFELCTMHRMKISRLTFRDYECLIQVNADPAAIIVRADAPWENLPEWLDAIRQSPGKLKMSGTSTGGAWDLARAGLLRAAGLPVDSVIWVPHQGSAPSVNELLGGHLDAICCSVPEVSVQVESGDLRILAVMSSERMAAFPELPTVKELGVDWEAVGWRGLALPKGTPQTIVDELKTTCLEIAESSAFAEFMNKNAFGIKIRATEEFEEFLEAQDQQWKEVVEAAGYDQGLAAKGDPGPTGLPIFLLLGICIALVVERFRNQAQDSDVIGTARDLAAGSGVAEDGVTEDGIAEVGSAPNQTGRALLFAVSLIVYVATIPLLGFPASTVLFVTSTAWRFGARWWVALIAGTLLVGVVHLLFTYVFEVQLPRGMFW